MKEKLRKKEKEHKKLKHSHGGSVENKPLKFIC